MDCTENVLGGHGPSSTVVSVDNCEKRELSHDVSFQLLNFMAKDDEDDAETWGRPRAPLRLPFTKLTDLEIQQPLHPSEASGSGIANSSRDLKHPNELTPAVAKESLATAEVNTSEGLAGGGQKGNSSINMSREVFASPPSLTMGGTRERGVNNTKSYVSLPRGQGFLPLRSPQARGPPYIPTLRSGVAMEVPPESTRMASNGSLANVSFPVPGQGHSLDNGPWAMPFLPRAPGLPCSPTGCFIPPRPPSSNPFLPVPFAFACPKMFDPPLLPHFAHVNFGGIRLPLGSNKEIK